MALQEVVTNSVLLSTLAFLVGIGIVLGSVEKFIEYVTDAAAHLGVSAFLLTAVFAGADWENAVLSLAAVSGGLSGMALGTMVGAAIFVLAVTVGLAGVLIPFETTAPPKYLALTLVSPLPLFVLTLDGELSLVDGLLLIGVYLPIVWILYRWETSGDTHYLRAEEVQGAAEAIGTNSASTRSTLIAAGLMIAAVAGMVLGSEITVTGARGILAAFRLDGLAFGATILSVIASLEEIFLTVEPVRQNRSEIGVGNIVGSTLFFVTVNAGVIALVRPIAIGPEVFTVHWPFLFGSLILVLAFLYRGTLTRLNGVVLLAVYVAYWGFIYLL